MIQGTTLSACQNLLTKGLNSNEAIIRNPAPDLEVDVTPIFVLGRGCYNPATGVTTM